MCWYRAREAVGRHYGPTEIRDRKATGWDREVIHRYYVYLVWKFVLRGGCSEGFWQRDTVRERR